MRRAGDDARAERDAGVPGAPFFFEGIESPNGTIFPDALLDQVMPFLSPSEWKVCSYIVRRTFGWKKANDRISLEQICHGIVRRDGSRLDHGTQIDRKTAIKALRGLEAKGVIVARRNYSEARGFEPTTYGLRFRGQTPSRTLGEKLPQGPDGPGEEFPQGGPEPLPLAPGEGFHQASGAPPPALVASGHPQATPDTTTEADEQQPARGAVRGAGMDDAALWARVLAQLAGQMTAANYATWLADTRPLGRHGAALVVGAPSGFVRDWLQTRFRPLVRRVLQDSAPDLGDVTFAVTSEQADVPD